MTPWYREENSWILTKPMSSVEELTQMQNTQGEMNAGISAFMQSSAPHDSEEQVVGALVQNQDRKTEEMATRNMENMIEKINIIF